MLAAVEARELADFLVEAGEDGSKNPRLEALVCRLNQASERLGRAMNNLTETLLLRLPISSSFRAGLSASRRAPAPNRRVSSPEADLYDAAATSGLFSDNRRSATALIWLSTSTCRGSSVIKDISPKTSPLPRRMRRSERMTSAAPDAMKKTASPRSPLRTINSFGKVKRGRSSFCTPARCRRSRVANRGAQ
jgi:hypothetical protein